MDIIIALLILSSIVLPIALYKRSKSLKFRIIEEHPDDYAIIYYPQVRVGGIWYGLTETAYLAPNGGKLCIDVHDAIVIIDLYKESGEGYIVSNRKLNKNEKEIIIE